MPIEHLPAGLRPFARRVRDFLITDSTAMLILGSGILIRGLSYTDWAVGNPPPPGAHPVENFFTLEAWAYVWILVGFLCIIAAFMRRTRIFTWALSIGVAINVMWGTSLILSTFIGDSPRGWVQSIGFFSMSALVLWAVWRGRATEIRISRS